MEGLVGINTVGRLVGNRVSGSIVNSYYDKNSTATGGTLLVLGIGKTKATS